MSKPLKVYTRPDNPGHSRPSPQGCYVRPAVLTPIDDESLPHPGDGKEWEWTLPGVKPMPVEVMTAPVGHYPTCVTVADVSDNFRRLHLVSVCSLRERKPEPEHEAPTVADAIRIAKKMHGVTRISREDNDFAIRFRHCGRWWRCAVVGMGFLVEEAGDGFLRSNKDAKEIQDTMEALWHQDERRSSDERRKGERRAGEQRGRRKWDTTRRPFHVSGDRRSGTDRRSS